MLCVPYLLWRFHGQWFCSCIRKWCLGSGHNRNLYTTRPNEKYVISHHAYLSMIFNFHLQNIITLSGWTALTNVIISEFVNVLYDSGWKCCLPQVIIITKNDPNTHHFRGLKIIVGVYHSVDLVMYMKKRNFFLMMTCVSCRLSFSVMFWQDGAHSIGIQVVSYNPNIYTI